MFNERILISRTRSLVYTCVPRTFNVNLLLLGWICFNPSIQVLCQISNAASLWWWHSQRVYLAVSGPFGTYFKLLGNYLPPISHDWWVYDKLCIVLNVHFINMYKKSHGQIFSSPSQERAAVVYCNLAPAECYPTKVKFIITWQ